MRHQIYRFNDVVSLLSISRSTLYDWIESGYFPRPLKLGRRAVGWISTEVHDWIEGRQNSPISDQEGK